MYNKIEMSNNLNFYIKRAGLTQARVAEMVGIRPESVNRHCSGRSAFSVNDAMTYAKILDCLPEQLLFEKKPAECIGSVHHLGRVDFKNKDEPRHFVTMHHSAPENIKLIKLNIAVGELSPLDGSFYMVNYDPIKNNYVDPDCFGRFCVMKCVHHAKDLRNIENFCYKVQDEKDLWMITRVGILYPQVVLGRDEKTYTFQNFYTKKIFTDIKPIYAASVVANVLRPDLLGWEEFEK